MHRLSPAELGSFGQPYQGGQETNAPPPLSHAPRRTGPCDPLHESALNERVPAVFG